MDGERRRGFAFQPPTGTIEQALLEAAQSRACLPDRITAALSASLQQLGGAEPTPERIAGLAVGDRQFLMRRLALVLGLNQSWMTSCCSRCGELFDYLIDHCRLPIKEAGASFPFAEVETSAGPLRLRVPSGADQAAVSGLEDANVVLKTLVTRCLIEFSGSRAVTLEPLVDELGCEDFQQIESALEEVAPEVTTRVRVVCSECGMEQLIEVDPYFVFGRVGAGLYREIHILASTYHWGEAEILQLPTGRRRRYLELIDQARGMRT